LSNYLIQWFGATFPWEKNYKISSRLSQYLPYHITYWYDILLLCLYCVIFIPQHNVGFPKCSLLNIVLPMLMFAFLLFDIMWSFFGESDSMRVFFIVCLYMYCRWIPSYQEVSWDHINWLTRNFCVQEPSQDIDFQRHMSWSPIVVSVSWSERWLFILLIIVECHTKIVLTFFS
jgi:hypothetical protein